jgi:outer membrane protein assembly factor BamB
MKWFSKLFRGLSSGHRSGDRHLDPSPRRQAFDSRLARKSPIFRKVKMDFDALEDRLAPATLAQSLYPDPTGPQEGGKFGSATATDTSVHVIGMAAAAFGAFDYSGSAYVYSATSGALIATLANPSPGQQDQFGSSVSVSGNIVVVGAPFDDTEATDSGQAYVFNATTGDLIATLASPSPASHDHFGCAVSISGNTVVVGARYDDTGASESGQAYVFDATTGAWIATLANPSPASGDSFGDSVSVSGNTAVVGVRGDDTGASDSGQAYVFNATTGALIATLANPSPAVSDQFGSSVSVSGNTVVVGATQDDTGATNNGQVYVFNATTGVLIVTLDNPTPSIGDEFGYSVSVSGNTVVVGAADSGPADVFNATTGALIATLDNPSPSISDQFGSSVAISGNTVIVGAPGEGQFVGSNFTYIGQAYVFNATTGDLVGTLENTSPAINDLFGSAVAVSEDVVVVSAIQDDAGATDSGRVYVFQTSTGALIATLDNPTPANLDRFGNSVSISGSTIVVGAMFDDAGAHDSGQAYVFDATTGALIATLANPSPSSFDFFGASVSVSGNTVVVGALNSGQAYLFDATTGDLISTLDNPAPSSSDGFGAQVSISGNTVVIGASGADTGSGLVYVFNATTGALITTLTNPTPGYDYYELEPEGGNYILISPGDRFGSSVSVSGNTVVVGAMWDDLGGTDAGQAYVFDATTGALIATLAPPSPAGGGEFGNSVSVSGNKVAVLSRSNTFVFNATTGAILDSIIGGFSNVALDGNTVIFGSWADDTQNFDQGAAYVYILDPGTTDGDSDGIDDDVDILPATFSNDFSDGVTYGTIVNRGDQVLTIVDAPNSADGVLITAGLTGGSVPAEISIAGGASTLSLQPGDQLIVTHGSVILHVLAGTVEATFVADSGEVATASLAAGNELTFEPESFVFSAPATNTETVQILVNGSEIDVGSGQSVRSVQIDVIPGSTSNTLNLASNGVISVAILSTAGFDAHTVDVASLLFAGAHATQSSFKDINQDGILDLVVNFRTQDTTLRSLYEHLIADDINEDGVLDSSHETASVSLSGLCQDGTAILGADAMDLFLSGKALRDMLATLAAAGVI